ncbi:putative ABC transporter permease subunit [Thermohalobacter berrensis]|uniref:Uncharacterized protein n=1 Tax=Thermohalobacter berrensis TaxID=99594 RepID=A0A419T348_9FIRM|nr:hypothetical protein [Thermohalobacter berrensis]RKD31957.1 hypothetical protein BET03_11810 [Thermohalobacter berrensis]
MRELMSLIKVNLNVNFGISAFKYKYFKQKKELWQPILFLVVISSLIPTYLLFLGFLNGVYKGFEMINQEGMFLLVGFLISQMVIFIFGIMYVASKFYFANDLKFLIPLPIKPSNIVISKFIAILVNEYLITLPINIPVVTIYALNNNTNILYWLYSILIILFVPIIPLALSSIIIMVFMRYTNIKARRDLIRVIGFILIIATIIGIQVGVQYMSRDVPQGQEQEYIANLVKEKNALVAKSAVAFPPSRWAAISLSNSNSIEGFTSFITFIGTSSIIFYLMVLLGERVFYKGLIGGEEVTAKKKKLSNKEFRKRASKANHPVVSILLREIKLLLRTPIFLINSIGAIIVIPIALLIPLIASPEVFEYIKGLYSEEFINIANYFLIGFVIFISATNGVASTTFSREGKQFWISRVAPVRVEYQVTGKILSSLLVQLLTIAVILITASFLVNLKISTILLVTTLGLLGSIPIIEIGMLIDILRPLLDWDNPQKAMKQNLNVLFSMVAGLLYMLIYGGLIFVLSKINLSLLVIYSIILIVFIILSIVLFMMLAGTTIKRYKEIE